MSKLSNRLNSSEWTNALKKLANDLTAINIHGRKIEVDEDMLSIIVNEALQGEDIAHRYPALYQSLLENSEFRQAFLEVLTSVEMDRIDKLTPLPDLPRTELGFLRNQSLRPFIEISERGDWHITWKKTAHQLLALFSSPEIAYRSDSSLFEDSWFTLLRDEVEVKGCTYAIVLECTTTNRIENVLAVFVTIAAMPMSKPEVPLFPLQASLQWGGQKFSVQFIKEGRTRFPDIPLDFLEDIERNTDKTILNLSLENIP